MEPEGVFNGRQAIEKALADLFQRWRPANFISEANKLNAMRSQAAEATRSLSALTGISGVSPDFMGEVEMFGTGPNRGAQSYWRAL